jgi:hypothetical protein
MSPNSVTATTDMTARPHTSVYCNRSRRWIEVSLQLAGGNGFRREWFLIDSGAPSSFLVEELAVGVSIQNLNERDKTGIIVVEGVSVEFHFRPSGGSENIASINLLGTDFMNSVVVLDDFLSGNLLILKRAQLPEFSL